MRGDRIDFISAYCDRWCERCRFTSRCSSYAVDVATAMCDGDVAAAIELAVGHPHPVGPPEPEPGSHDDILDAEPTAQEMAAATKEQRERDARADDSRLMRVGRATTLMAHRWLSARRKSLESGADPILREAIDTAGWDATFILPKIHRAIDGRDRSLHGDQDEHPVQNDWNGSAKVAMLCLERSESAWQAIAQATRDDTPAGVAHALWGLRQLMQSEFPRAMHFVRPGFDEPGR